VASIVGTLARQVVHAGCSAGSQSGQHWPQIHDVSALVPGIAN
jgi:hypothetical protein